MKKLAIIGGGITGLSAAFYLEKARRSGAALDYRLFERSSRLGGALFTEQIDGCTVEAGADSFLTEKPWAQSLCRDLGIEDQLIGSNDRQRQTFIFRKGKLIPLPPGMVFFVPTDLAAIKNSALFSAASKRRISRETLMRTPDALDRDMSVADFVARHFGSEMLQRVADPLLAGIYGGDAGRLSIRAVMPRFLELELQFGSLIRALHNANQNPRRASQPLFTSLHGGMQQLVDALVRELRPGSVETNADVWALDFTGGKWRVLRSQSTEETEDYDSILLAVPAYAASQLLRSVAPQLAKYLKQIPYSSSSTVALGYSTEAFDSAAAKKLKNASLAKHAKGAKQLQSLQGFGFLVPYGEPHRALACTFVHNKFPGRVPAGRFLLRVFFGGVRDERSTELSDDALIRLARRELKSLLKLGLPPSFARVHRWYKAMPQYNVGHLEVLRKIEEQTKSLPGLRLAGNAYYGVGISDCIRQGRDAAQELLAIA